jgi:hypothetical protein
MIGVKWQILRSDKSIYEAEYESFRIAGVSFWKPRLLAGWRHSSRLGKCWGTRGAVDAWQEFLQPTAAYGPQQDLTHQAPRDQPFACSSPQGW